MATAVQTAAGLPAADRASRQKGTPANSGPALPAPLNDEGIAAALKELPEGTRRATEACLKCYKEKKFTAADILSFARSICSQSPTLNKMMRENVGQAVAKRGAGAAKQAQVAKPAPTQYHTYDASRGNMPARAIVRVDMVEHLDTKFEKTEDAVDMTAKLIERRRREVRRRQLSAFPGNNGEKRSRYMSSVIKRLGAKVPDAGKTALRDAIRAYVAEASTPEQFVHALQNIVDEYGTTVALEYTPEHQTRAPAVAGVHSNKRGSSQAAAARKKAKLEAAPAVVNIDSSPSPTSSSGALSPKAEPVSESAEEHANALGQPDGPLCSSELQDTPLGDYLTAKAAGESAPERHVTVKVVSQTTGHTGSGDTTHPYRTKSIFAFQRMDSQGEIMLMGMYVHEFGPDAPEETRGRVLIECVDSIPIHGSERSEERQKLLTAIIHGYLEYCKGQGFTTVHFRVPPPSAENHHIFTARSLSVRLEATVRMAHWYRRLLESAARKGLVANLELQSHLSKMSNFPPVVLPSSDLAEEHAFSTMRSELSRTVQSGARTESEVRLFEKLASFKDRFCVAALHESPLAAPKLWPEATPDLPTALTASRQTFVAACKRESLSFGSLADAKMSTMLLLARMIADQRRHAGYRVGTGSAESAERGNAHLHTQERQDMGLSPEALVEFHVGGGGAEMSHAPTWAAGAAHDHPHDQSFSLDRNSMTVEDLHWDDLGGGGGGGGDMSRLGDSMTDLSGGFDAEMFADSLLTMSFDK